MYIYVCIYIYIVYVYIYTYIHMYVCICVQGKTQKKRGGIVGSNSVCIVAVLS